MKRFLKKFWKLSWKGIPVGAMLTVILGVTVVASSVLIGTTQTITQEIKEP